MSLSTGEYEYSQEEHSDDLVAEAGREIEMYLQDPQGVAVLFLGNPFNDGLLSEQMESYLRERHLYSSAYLLAHYAGAMRPEDAIGHLADFRVQLRYDNKSRLEELNLIDILTSHYGGRIVVALESITGSAHEIQIYREREKNANQDRVAARTLLVQDSMNLYVAMRRFREAVREDIALRIDRAAGLTHQLSSVTQGLERFHVFGLISERTLQFASLRRGYGPRVVVTYLSGNDPYNQFLKFVQEHGRENINLFWWERALLGDIVLEMSAQRFGHLGRAIVYDRLFEVMRDIQTEQQLNVFFTRASELGLPRVIESYWM